MELAAFSAVEESFFAEGDALSAIPEEIVDCEPYAWSRPSPIMVVAPEAPVEAAGYYASLHLTVEADEVSGELAA